MLRSVRVHSIWSYFSMDTVLRTKEYVFLQVGRAQNDPNVRMSKLTQVFDGHKIYN